MDISFAVPVVYQNPFMSQAQFRQLTTWGDAASLKVQECALKIGVMQTPSALEQSSYGSHHLRTRVLRQVVLPIVGTSFLIAIAFGGVVAARVAALALAALSCLAYQVYRYKSGEPTYPSWFPTEESQCPMAFVEVSPDRIAEAWYNGTVPQKELEIGILFRTMLIQEYPTIFSEAYTGLEAAHAKSSNLLKTAPSESRFTRPLTDAYVGFHNGIVFAESYLAIAAVEQKHLEKINAIYQQARQEAST